MATRMHTQVNSAEQSPKIALMSMAIEFWKKCQPNSMGKVNSFQQVVQENLYIHLEKNKLHTIYKN